MTLTQAAIVTRRGIVVSIILIVLSISGVIGYNIWYQYYLSQLPVPVEKPEMKFGALPLPIFPKATVSSANYSYSIDTVTGQLPEMPKMMKVYFLPRLGLSLMAPEKAKELAVTLGFNSEPKVLSTTQYQFSDNQDGALFIDLSTGNFNLIKNRPKDATSSADTAKSKEVLSDGELAANFKNYLSSKKLLQADLNEGKIAVIKSKDKALVSLWPKDFDNTPVVTASSSAGLVRGLIDLNSTEEDPFVEVHFTFWPIDETISSTYPLKTPASALSDLRGGKGFIVLEGPKPQVSLTSLRLAYYQSEEYTPYLLPVYVFEGEKFIALVAAIEEITANPN